MAETFRLEITTPERRVVHLDVEEAQIPAQNGYIGVLPGHTPLLAELKPGEISYRHAGRTDHLAISCGFVEVLPDHTRVLVETAEKFDEIDVARAEAARQRADERLHQPTPDTDIERARRALDRAIARLLVARKPSK